MYAQTLEKQSTLSQVKLTNDLDQFKTVKGNRPPNLQHIKRLTHSMKQHGVLMNPIIINENFEVIDGQHRLMAAKSANMPIYYIIAKGYNLKEVHALNLNQKNWTKKDFMLGYAKMGIESYIKLKNFAEKNNDFTFSDCITLCSNSSSQSFQMSNKYRASGICIDLKEVFEEGTWKGKDFALAQDYANKIRMIKNFYDGYNRSTFVGTMIGMFQNKNFSLSTFISKLKLQPTALTDCATREQYKLLIEEIYNYKNRNKVNLRY